MDGSYRWTDPAAPPAPPQPMDPTLSLRPADPSRKRFGARTILIPAGAMAGHFFIALLVSLVFSLVITFQLILKQGVNPADPAALMEAIGQEAMDRIMMLSTRITTIYSVIHLAVFIPVLRFMGRKDSTFFLNEKPRPSHLLSAVAIATGAVGAVSLLFMGYEKLAESMPFMKEKITAYEELSRYFSGDGGLAWILIGTCLLVPLAEEIIFRGVIQNELRRVMPIWLAVVLQAVIFALFHMNFIQSSYVIIPALLMGAAYAWTRSFAVPVVMHIVFNLLGAGIPAILGESPAGAVVAVVEFAFIAVGALCVLWLHANRRTERKMQDGTI